MTNESGLQFVFQELESGVDQAKCRKCGCMQEVLANLQKILPEIEVNSPLTACVSTWEQAMQPIRYACLGCDHCYPAVAQNEFVTIYPSTGHLFALDCDFQAAPAGWPPVVGEYFVADALAPVAVSTLASTQLAEDLANQSPAGLAIAGKTETENIGIDKVIKNVISNSSIRYLIVTGRDSAGHKTGQTFLALAENGVDAAGRVIGSPGKRPVLRNVSPEEIKLFRQQVQIIDMIGQEDVGVISARISELADQGKETCGCDSCCDQSVVPVSAANIPTVIAAESENEVILDRAGYFVIVPLPEHHTITVEHYDYNNTLLRTIQGATAREIYKTIVTNKWVTELSHAAYLGRELTRAEWALTENLKYVQDGA